MAYPLEVGGVDDYPVKVGSMLLTMVEPHEGYERAYNRWYERDHFYAGCMIGPWLFAGSRWVATRPLKDLRWPKDDNAIAKPYDAGSYVAIYWVEKGHHKDHFEGWATPQVRDLYASGRGFSERSHVHTSMFNHLGSAYREEDPVPVDLALDHGYDGLVALWWDAKAGTAEELRGELEAKFLPDLLAGSGIEIASSWTPSSPDEATPRRTDGPRLLRRRDRTARAAPLCRRRRHCRARQGAKLRPGGGVGGPGRPAPGRSLPADGHRHRQVRRPAALVGLPSPRCCEAKRSS